MRSFVKYEGAGNDFVLIDDRDFSFPVVDKALIQSLCDRKKGIGADGVILFQAPCIMRIFNADGSEAESCGNGLRCFLAFLSNDLNIIQDHYEIVIGPRVVTGWQISKTEFAVDMGNVFKAEPNRIVHLDKAFHYIDSGVPHLVHFVPDTYQVDLEQEGAFFRSHPAVSPQGANVNFVSEKEGSFYCRTFERGVEGETLACGTGAVAVAYWVRRLFSKKGKIPIQFPGGQVTVYEQGEHWIMQGPARAVFQGTYR